MSTRAKNAAFTLHKICVLLHLIQGVTALVIGLGDSRTGRFRLPITTTFSYFISDTKAPVQRTIVRFMLPLTAVASSFEFVSAVSHGYVVLNRRVWELGVARGVNNFRWAEYAVSSSVMMMLIAALVGMYDAVGLSLVGVTNACVMFMGYAMEHVNQQGKGPFKRVKWWPFFAGSAIGVVPWIVVFVYTAPNSDVLPAFVWAIIATYLLLFASFPGVMIARYTNRLDAFSAEKAYCVLSIVSKSLLLWLIVGGTNQPNDAGN